MFVLVLLPPVIAILPLSSFWMSYLELIADSFLSVRSSFKVGQVTLWSQWRLQFSSDLICLGIYTAFSPQGFTSCFSFKGNTKLETKISWSHNHSLTTFLLLVAKAWNLSLWMVLNIMLTYFKRPLANLVSQGVGWAQSCQCCCGCRAQWWGVCVFRDNFCSGVCSPGAAVCF